MEVPTKFSNGTALCDNSAVEIHGETDGAIVRCGKCARSVVVQPLKMARAALAERTEKKI